MQGLNCMAYLYVPFFQGYGKALNLITYFLASLKKLLM